MILQFISLILCAAVFFQAEPLLNRMGGQCCFSLRFAFFFLAMCSAALGLFILQGFHPKPLVILAQLAAALGLFAHRVSAWRWPREHITRRN